MIEEHKLYEGSVKIFFDSGTTERPKHLYTDKKGNKPISVTGVTGIVDKSRGLMWWATREEATEVLEHYKIVKKGYFDITDKVDKEEKKRRWKELLLDIKDKEIETSRLELADSLLTGIGRFQITSRKAANIGTEIHEWVSDWILGKKPEMPEDEKVVNGITAFLKFIKEHKVKWLGSEMLVYSKKHNYVGTLDALAQIGKELVLVDFKSSTDIFDEMRFQVSGYQIAWEEEHKKKIDRRMIIRFGKNDGEFELKELDEDAKDKKAFLACLELAKRIRELQNNGY